ncbi:MAG: hypothetical protein UW86_C0014G0012 [Microgenomates group bacterium GW2011_GWA1_Microgenomates_45_10]|nr:MAG: hypothetical protein UW73_C0009G0024 [Microgenomates group bacterium GW2011_GWB1_44_8]KKT86938.1 MAG: hypothetical protein UW86_C0014G0012 [Microgenomates group bacterium GW2011_GWA1_Microgenomates_45_10]
MVAAISIPVFLIVAVIISIYLPSLFFKPKTNFLYLVDNPVYDSTCSQNLYSVVNGKLITSNEGSAYECNLRNNKVEFYVHDIRQNQSRPISFYQAQAFNLSPSPRSPDGYEIVSGGNGNVFPIFYVRSDYGVKYLEGRGTSQKLSLQFNTDQPYKFRFLGWILD